MQKKGSNRLANSTRRGPGPGACCLLFLLLALPGSEGGGWCQSLPVLDYSGRSTEKRPDLLQEKPPAPSPVMTLPPAPAPAGEPAGTLVRSVLVRRIVVTGSTVFSDQEIARVTAPYENRENSMATLESLRRDLTLLYLNKGYVNSGAVIPDQTVADGVVTLRIVEGKLTTIHVTGNKGFRQGFLKDRIALGAGVPLDILPLQERLQLLQQDPRLERIQAELDPGANPGESELKVKVVEKPPISLWLAFNNYQSPSVGGEQGLATLTHQNLTGRGDILSFTYGYADGLNPIIDTWYALPLNAYDTTLLLRYRHNDARVVDSTFRALNIVSRQEGFELSLRQPVYRSLNQELALTLSAEHERNTTTLDGEPFSFSPGAENGKTVVVPLRFAQDWTYRTQRQVVAARSRLSFGLGGWDATAHDTRNGANPDGRFFAWLGQLQLARVLSPWDLQLLGRVDYQFANHSLLPVEQIGVGGRYTVRGFRENYLVRDRAVIASLESRLPVLQNRSWAEYLQVCPFLDYGRGTNVNIPASGPSELSSAGVGLRWGANLLTLPFGVKSEAEIYWGHPLRELPHPHDDIQDDGVHFQLAFTGSF